MKIKKHRNKCFCDNFEIIFYIFNQEIYIYREIYFIYLYYFVFLILGE